MMTAPLLLLLLGGSDHWEPPHFCEVAGLQPSGPPVTVHIYTAATHAFDDAEARGSRTANGNLVLFAYAPLSASDAHKRALAFFGDQMRLADLSSACTSGDIRRSPWYRFRGRVLAAAWNHPMQSCP
jgi:hypothetical protein